jgi:hypothetical protein
VATDSQVLSQSVHWTKAIDSALLIVLLTAGAYAIAFQYESGYLSYFGVPADYAKVKAGRLVAAAAVALFSIGMAAMLWSTLKLVLARVAPLHLAVANRLAHLIIWLLIALLLANEIEGPFIAKALMFALPTILLVGELAMPLITHRHLLSYAEQLETSVLEDLAREREGHGAEPQAVVVRIAAPVVAVFLLVALLLTDLAHAAGAHVAGLQSQFLVAASESPCAVLSSSSQGLLCASFDADKRVALREFRFLKAEDTVVTLSAIGPLAQVEPPHAPEPPPAPDSGSAMRWHPVL